MKALYKLKNDLLEAILFDDKKEINKIRIKYKDKKNK